MMTVEGLAAMAIGRLVRFEGVLYGLASMPRGKERDTVTIVWTDAVLNRVQKQNISIHDITEVWSRDEQTLLWKE